MTFSLIAVFASGLVAAVIALAREIRVRRALQRLLHHLLTHWKAHAQPPPHPNKTDSAIDHVCHDQRL
jgi:hypothetical protein